MGDPLLEDYKQRLNDQWNDIRCHMQILWDSVIVRKSAVTIELGTRKGNSTSAFLNATLRNGGHLWSCDLNKPEVPAWWSMVDWWTFVQGDDTDPAVSAQLPAQCDVLFIDTSHLYEHTLQELEMYAPRVRPGGLVFCHDTQWHEGDVDSGEPDGSVAKALGQYCRTTRMKWSNMSGDYGLGVIRVSA